MGAEGDSSDTASVAAGEVSVNIRCSNGSKFTVKMTLDSNVGDFKSVVAQNCDVPADQQRLIYKGIEEMMKPKLEATSRTKELMEEVP
ncbi:ubiquitin domain-containing protein DSK2b-like [Spinacia oleracea]|uniref:Ubiquitin domain-containing protein DSK2b-like n=1 Tax=Spinacia oleracea TaxID=3562 RepID=A0A9R0IBY5_SPIOL|nr:ubiquitin domain-containing protein DSK2b-like [Spinacia oleracea]